jgi:hypothetical protein
MVLKMTNLIFASCLSAAVPASAEPGTDKSQDVTLAASNDACASTAAFLIAPQVFLEGDMKNLPDWIATCNANPDKTMCNETIKIISDYQKQVPPELKCE